MIYELRIYTTVPGRMPNLLARFENHTLKLWEKHGIKQVGFWYAYRPCHATLSVKLATLLLALTNVPCRTTLVGPDANDLTYLLAWESMADREKKWNAFFADPDWQKVKAESEADGAINARVQNQFLAPTKFSAIQ